jgi:xylan 1,4-beta-xylosidase
MNRKILFASLILFVFYVLHAQKTVRIEVDAIKKTGMLEPFWASQIIHPTEFILTEWGAEFVSLLAKTGAAQQFIRIYNQPEKAIRVDAKGNISYDWSIFDKMAETILLSGNKLKIVFFGMPYEIALFPESVKKRPYGGLVCISSPKDYKLWEEMCADFTRHVIGKYGLEEVKQWTFRCWNEPDHGGFWHKGNLSEYMKLYDYFAKGVKDVCPDIKIGGPALTSTGTYNNPDNLRMFYEHVTNDINHATGEKGVPIDFIAIHTYGGSGAGPGPGRKFPEADYMIEQQIMCADMRDEYEQLKNLPIHVEEWGESSGGTTGVRTKPVADIRNSQYGAAFLTYWVGRHIRMQLDNDRKIEGFTFCSSGYEQIPEADFMGYRTLNTKNGFYKPILNGYQLLKKLDRELIQTHVASNKNILSYATRSENRICVLITNYQYEHPFNDGIAERISLEIKHHWGETANMTVKHYRIDEHHSNAYSVFKKSGSPELIDPIMIDAIKKRMNLELVDEPLQIKGKGKVSLPFILPCNAVSLIEIESKDF